VGLKKFAVGERGTVLVSHSIVASGMH
jgi:hypothetical protein